MKTVDPKTLRVGDILSHRNFPPYRTSVVLVNREKEQVKIHTYMNTYGEECDFFLNLSFYEITNYVVVGHREPDSASPTSIAPIYRYKKELGI